jgi:RNA polymerase sigma-70 factor (ECF subfamily)
VSRDRIERHDASTSGADSPVPGVEMGTGDALPNPSAVADAGLVVRTLSGEKEAFDLLVRKHQKRAVSVAYSYLSNEDDAREVTQEAFLKVFLNLATLQRPEAFLSFLLRTTSNLALNFRRGRRLRKNPGLEESFLSGDENPEPGGVQSDHTIQSTRPGRALEDKELGERRRRAMASLPEKQRLAIELFAVQGLPQKEVAEALDCSVEAVKWYVFQGRKRLKELLKDVL